MDTWTPEDGIIDPFELAEQGRWLDLARLGKDAWNTWAESEVKKPERDRATINLAEQEIFVSDFSNFIFPGSTFFTLSTFSKGGNFRSAKFYDEVYFMGVVFSEGSDFYKASFFKEANFNHVKFNKFSGFNGTLFNNDALFNASLFSEGVDFRNANFAVYAAFNQVIFADGANFGSAIFKGDASFDAVTVDSIFDLTGAMISGNFYSRATSINGHAYFTAIEFAIPPNFVSTEFKNPPSFLGSTFCYPSDNPLWGKCSIIDGEARYRRLKQLAAENHNHEMELVLFAHETRAKRFHSQRLLNPQLFISYIYEWISDFGQSWTRPLAWLVLTVGLAATAYQAMVSGAHALATGFISFSSISWISAGLNVFPFAGQAVIGREIMVAGLCPDVPGTTEPALDCLMQLYTISAVEGVFGLIFLFLIGLGLRNRFRIK